VKISVVSVVVVFAALLGQYALGADFAQMRVAHLSLFAPAVDVWVDGTLIWGDVDFNVITAYLLVRTGEHRVQLSLAGESVPVVEALVNLKERTAYTLATLGPWNLGDITPSLFVDDLSVNLLTAKVRFLHASIDLPAVDVAVVGGPVLAQNLAFGQASAYVSVTPGTYDLELRLAGTNTAVLSIPEVPLNRMTNCTLFTIGLWNGKLAVLPVADLHSRVNIISIWLGALLWAAIVGWFIAATAK
jgi:hypothetical protein